MTTLLDTRAATPDAPQRRRHRRVWLAVLAGVLVVALVVAATWFEVYVRTYQPLVNYGSVGATTGGPRAGHVGETSDGLNDTTYALLGRTGSTATIEYTMSNSGSHAVRVLGLARSVAPYWVTGVKWGPFANGPDGTVGSLSQARPFPVTMKPHSQIVLEVSVVKRGCGGGAGSPLIVAVPLRWMAYGIFHTWSFTMPGEPFDNLPILICPPKAALRRLDPRF